MTSFDTFHNFIYLAIIRKVNMPRHHMAVMPKCHVSTWDVWVACCYMEPTCVLHQQHGTHEGLHQVPCQHPTGVPHQATSSHGWHANMPCQHLGHSGAMSLCGTHWGVTSSAMSTPYWLQLMKLTSRAILDTISML